MVTTRESRHAASSNISPLDPRLQDPQPADADHQVLRAALNDSLYPQPDNQFAGLVEAATAAAGQETAWTQGDGFGSMQHRMGSYASHIHGMPTDMPDLNGDGTGHHYPVEGLQENTKRTTRKRKRVSSPPEQQVHFDGDLDIRDLPPQQSLAEARAAGVHSAAALFRRPSSTSKKYTRPPMSTLFGSLELTPENFLHLQSAAKTYMLDENHPERRECVGQRGKGDGDMAKLALWHCVEAFLEQDGIGERYFGEQAISEEIGRRTLVWPAEKQKIIKAVVPLCRRMVTNERQREYAVRTRKGGGAETAKSTETEDAFQPSHQASHNLSLPSFLQSNFEEIDRQATTKPSFALPTSENTTTSSNMASSQTSLILQVVILRASRRYVPTLILSSDAAPNLNSLRHKVEEHLFNNGKPAVEGHGMKVKVHLADGLVKIDSDGEWTVSLLSAGEVEWMAGEVKVVVAIDDGDA